MNIPRNAIVTLVAAAFAGGAQASDFTPAFQANSTPEVLRTLGAADAASHSALRLKAPRIAEIGSSVAIEVSSRIPNTEWIAIIADKNPTPLAAVVRINDKQPTMQTRIKLVEPSQVRVVAKAGGRYYTTDQFVKVVEGGCGGGSASVAVDQSSQRVGNTGVRSRANDDGVLVQLMIQHPMETGLRQNKEGKMVQALDAKSGKPVAPHYIQRVRARVNDNSILDAYWGPSISSTPIFGFGVSQYRKGDQVTVEWEDNQGKRGGNKTTLGGDKQA